MASLTANILIKTTYKALLKTASRLDRLVPLPDMAVELGRFKGAAAGASSFRAVVRDQFRSSPADIDIAFAALREGNIRVAELVSPASASASKPQALPVARFAVGQVFRHRKFGYRAVIIEADESCRASLSWMTATGTARLARGATQPFYTCLVDIRDRPGAQISYVAEENVDLVLSPPGAEGIPLVLHPLIAKHFVAYNRGLFLAEGAVDGDGRSDGSSSAPESASGAKSMAA
jgi:hemimethylated DNA binding protein